MAGYQVFQIEMRKNFKESDFHDKLKELYHLCGVECKQTVFLFSDTQILHETFLEDVNNILSSGEVPGLFNSDHLAQLREELRNDPKV